jgi:hypothetical protein
MRERIACAFPAAAARAPEVTEAWAVGACQPRLGGLSVVVEVEFVEA